MTIVTKWALLVLHAINGQPQAPLEYIYSDEVSCRNAAAAVEDFGEILSYGPDNAIPSIRGVGGCFPVEGLEIPKGERT